MHETEMAPDPQLMESMRAVGYTLETAVADVIDNSITARASVVDVAFAGSPSPWIAIFDDGEGMDQNELQQAMRLAGKSSRSERDHHDLGRFGLGLKTASLSQCRTLTVLSRRDGVTHGVRWSLDHVLATGRWALLLLDAGAIREVPLAERLERHETGTVVVWQNLDQIHAHDNASLDVELDDRMVRVRDHLALVFHRFVEPHGNAVNVSISVNSRPVPSLDPFLTSHRATQVSEAETVEVDGEPVRLQSFTLPYINRMTNADKQKAQVSGTLRDTQGFYVYRAGRLVIWGTWFRIVPKDDLGKLARVRVDIPNSLDHLWALDIKKSTADPPPAVRSVLKRLATRFVRPSRTTHAYRGRPTAADPMVRLWQVVDERGEFRYELNRAHPAIEAFAEQLGVEQLRDFQRILQTVEAAFPVEDAYNRLGKDAAHRPTSVAPDEIAALAQQMWVRRSAGGEDLHEFIARLASTEPFSTLPSPESDLEKMLG